MGNSCFSKCINDNPNPSNSVVYSPIKRKKTKKKYMRTSAGKPVFYITEINEYS